MTSYQERTCFVRSPRLNFLPAAEGEDCVPLPVLRVIDRIFAQHMPPLLLYGRDMICRLIPVSTRSDGDHIYSQTRFIERRIPRKRARQLPVAYRCPTECRVKPVAAPLGGNSKERPAEKGNLPPAPRIRVCVYSTSTAQP